jgi:hypothetical protein
MSKSHYYLVDTSVVTKGTAVSKLQFQEITEEPFFVHGLKVSTLHSHLVHVIYKVGIL